MGGILQLLGERVALLRYAGQRRGKPFDARRKDGALLPKRGGALLPCGALALGASMPPVAPDAAQHAYQRQRGYACRYRAHTRTRQRRNAMDAPQITRAPTAA